MNNILGVVDSEKYELECYESIYSLPLKYDAIFSLYSDDDIFLSRSWFELFEKHVANQQDGKVRLYGLVLKSSPEIAVFLLPLWEKRSFGGAVKTLHSLSNFYTGNYEPLYAKNKVILGEVFLTFLNALIATKRWDQIDLRSLTHNTPLYQQVITAIQRCNCLYQQYFICGNWYLDVDSSGYGIIKNNRPGSLRSTLTRKGKKYLRMDGAVIDVLIGKQIDAQRVKDYWSVYDNSWKSDEAYKSFVDALVMGELDGGEIVLGVAYLKNEPIAAQVWIVRGGVAYIYKLAHLAKYDKLSVGTILLDKIMESVYESYEICKIDFLTGDDPYKSKWMNSRAEKWGVIVFNKKTLFGLISGFINIFGQKIKRLLISSVGVK